MSVAQEIKMMDATRSPHQQGEEETRQYVAELKIAGLLDHVGPSGNETLP
jgi:hypothetical protein